MTKDLFDARFTAKFWSKVAVVCDSDCWLWGGTIGQRGRPVIKHGSGKNLFAHRVAYCLTTADIQSGQYICHSCDNIKCCNPNHLFAGSQKDNMGDCKRKDRHARGERHASCKLSIQDVNEIRRRYEPKAGPNGPRAMAKEFGVTRAHIRSIAKGLKWSHIPLIRPIPKYPHPPKKLTIQKAREIRNRQPHFTVSQLARDFSVDRSTIKAVLKGETWKYA